MFFTLPVTEGEVTAEEMMLPMPDGVELKTYLFHMAQDDLWEGAEQQLFLLTSVLHNRHFSIKWQATLWPSP